MTVYCKTRIIVAPQENGEQFQRTECCVELVPETEEDRTFLLNLRAIYATEGVGFGREDSPRTPDAARFSAANKTAAVVGSAEVG